MCMYDCFLCGARAIGKRKKQLTSFARKNVARSVFGSRTDP